MSNFTTALRRTAIGCVPVVALLFLTPPRQAHAGLLDFLLNTVNAIGNTISQVNSLASTAASLQQSVVFPVSNLANIEANGQTLIGSYRGWMSSVYGESNFSARTPSAQTLESKMLSGSSGSASPQLGTQYQAAYGTLPTPQQAPVAVQQQVDMNDATAEDAMSFAVLADSNATSTIQMGNSIEDQAMTASAGNAPILEATALAYSLQSMAVEHKLYAAELRTLATKLANRGAVAKQSAINSTNITGAVSSLNGAR